jgi:hypothetical protein
MKRFPAVILILAALGLTVKPVLADDTSERALASQLIDMTRGKEAMRAGIDSVFNGVIQNLAQHGLPQAGIDEFKGAIDKWYAAEINFEDIRPKLIDAYVKEFTEDDLKQIVTFYQSPVGQKAIKEMPGVMKEGASIEQDYTKDKIATLDAQLTPILTKYRDQMEAAGGAAGGPPADSGPPSGGAPGMPGPAGN